MGEPSWFKASANKELRSNDLRSRKFQSSIALNINKEKNKKRRLSNDNNHVEYIVEQILGFKYTTHGLSFFIKWLGYPQSMNSWEKVANLEKCSIFLNYIENLYECIEADIHIHEIETYKKLDARIKKESKRPKAEIINWLKNFDELEFMIYQTLYHFISSQTFRNMHDELFIKSHFYEIIQKYKKESRKLKVNFQVNEKLISTVIIENEIDFDLPNNFSYIAKNQFEDLNKDEEVEKKATIQCKCQQCSTSSICCATYNNKRAYKIDENGVSILKVDDDEAVSAIVECGDSCNCDITCSNRVSQQLRSVALSVFKTEKRGWGLKALTSFTKGAFVIECVGKYVQRSEAKKRDVKSHFFNVNFDGIKFILDAYKCSNISRFINHSCDPNSHIFIITNGSNDKTSIKLGVFALRDIAENEEITVNYQKCSIGQQEIIQCLCESAKCKGFIYDENLRSSLEIDDEVEMIVENNETKKKAATTTDNIMKENSMNELRDKDDGTPDLLVETSSHSQELTEPNTSYTFSPTEKAIRGFACPEEGCNKTYGTAKDLNKHKKRYHYNKEVVICICGFAFRDETQFDRHVIFVNKRLKNFDSFVEDLKAEHGIENYQWVHDHKASGPCPPFSKNQVYFMINNYKEYLTENFRDIVKFQNDIFAKRK